MDTGYTCSESDELDECEERDESDERDDRRYVQQVSLLAPRLQGAELVADKHSGQRDHCVSCTDAMHIFLML